jgi:DNA-binding transcriptional regulator YiaG
VNSLTSFLPTSLPLRTAVPEIAVIIIGGTLAMHGTSSFRSNRVLGEPYHLAASATDANPRDSELLALLGSWTVDDRETARRAVSEIRRLSGLTWEQMGVLFQVSRRSVHFWASGKSMNAANEERLMRVLQVIRDSYRGSAQSTRTALVTPVDGVVPFDLLAKERFDEARRLLVSGTGGTMTSARVALSPAAERTRRPLRPSEIVDASHESVHREVGRGRGVRTARTIGRERDG